MEIKEVVKISKAMSDENRIHIIQNLTKGTKCACNLLDELQITQPTLSHHMKILTDCNLVTSRKDGKWQYYTINCEKFKEYKEFMNQISCVDEECCCCK